MGCRQGWGNEKTTWARSHLCPDLTPHHRTLSLSSRSHSVHPGHAHTFALCSWVHAQHLTVWQIKIIICPSAACVCVVSLESGTTRSKNWINQKCKNITHSMILNPLTYQDRKNGFLWWPVSEEQTWLDAPQWLCLSVQSGSWIWNREFICNIYVKLCSNWFLGSRFNFEPDQSAFQTLNQAEEGFSWDGSKASIRFGRVLMPSCLEII